jgi:hypothetical protein
MVVGDERGVIRGWDSVEMRIARAYKNVFVILK